MKSRSLSVKLGMLGGMPTPALAMTDGCVWEVGLAPWQAALSAAERLDLHHTNTIAYAHAHQGRMWRCGAGHWGAKVLGKHEVGRPVQTPCAPPPLSPTNGSSKVEDAGIVPGS